MKLIQLFLLFPLLAWPLQAQQLYDAALPELGATAKGSKAKFNKDWPAQSTLTSGKRNGSIFDPIEGGVIDIRLVMPVEIKAVDITAFNYRNNRTASGVVIFIEDKQVAESDLPNEPGKVTRVPAEGTGQNVRLVFKAAHPVLKDPKTGKDGPNWGGIGKIAVMSPVNLVEKLKHVDTYNVPANPGFIAATTQSAEKAKVEVFGEPRKATSHPRTLWDQQDVDHFKAMLKTSPELAKQYADLKKSMDGLLAKPPEVPQPVKDDDGKWTHLPDKVVGKTHNELALHISNLGTVYALSGEEKYADAAKKILLAYADAFEGYAPGNRPGFTHDQGRLFDQRLSDATWLIPVARGYDLIHSSKGITPDERTHIQNDLLKACAKFIAANSSVMRAPTNWSAICTTSVLITGYATDDEELVNLALFGPGGTEDNPKGGVMLHFSDKAINSDGLWAEGAIGYQFMAMQALTADAEILWRNGRDMYRHRDGAMKKLFDSPIAYSFPDLRTPSVHDSGSTNIVGRESYLYEFGYLRYKDPRYLLILNNPTVSTRLDTRFQQFPISVLYDRDKKEQVPPIEWLSENFIDVGYGILRNTTANGTVSLLMDYGPNRSHGHPDKLNIDLWTTKTGRLIPDLGMVWYEQPLYKNWYHTSLAHNTLTVDEQEQIASDGQLLVYGYTDTMAIQRGNALAAAPGVTMDRAVFLTPEYLADIFGAFARLPRKLDLAWHIRGDFSSDLPLKPFTFPEPRERGYSELANTTAAKTDKAWSAQYAINGQTIRLLAAGATPTEIITGDGWYGRERPRSLIQRRQAHEALYGNAVDISCSKEGFVKSVALEGSLEKGYGLLTAGTVKGKDLCFAAYRPGTYKAGDLETDALQAFVRTDKDGISGLFLGGGKTLKSGPAQITLSAAGTVALEKSDNGAYILSNLSTHETQVTLAFPPVAGMELHQVDAKGKRTGSPAKAGGPITLASGQKVEFARPNTPSVYDSRAAMLKKRQEEQEAAMKVELEAATARSKQRGEAAAAKPAPANTQVFVQAEAFKAEGDGTINPAPNKTGHIGSSLSGWNGEGHWLEWEIEVPAEGYYNLSLCYCTESNNSQREIKVNGEVQEPYAPLTLGATGGFSNGTDDWKLATAMDPVTEKPLLVKFKQGKNLLRLTNANGESANIDYLFLTSPDVKPTREMAASKAK